MAITSYMDDPFLRTLPGNPLVGSGLLLTQRLQDLDTMPSDSRTAAFGRIELLMQQALARIEEDQRMRRAAKRAAEAPPEEWAALISACLTRVKGAAS